MKKFTEVSFLCLVLLCSSCNNTSPSKEHALTSTPAETTVFQGNAMTIDYRIIVGQPLSHEEKQTVDKLIHQVFEHVNLTYNKWNPLSEISKLNRLKAGTVASISKDLEQFLNQIDSLVNLTEGRFDPTIEPLQQVWKSHLEKGTFPAEAEIEKVLPAVGWKKIHFGNQLFSKDHDLTSLDLGGIAKGLCVDLLMQKLNQAGYHDVFVEWGGEIAASGQHPEKRLWNIFISRLGNTDPNQAIAHVALDHAAIATSGNYLQNWTIQAPGLQNQQLRFCHIIDPWTCQFLKMEQNTVASASVLAPNCTLADALATAAMMFPNISDAKAWSEAIRKKHPELLFWFASQEDVLLPSQNAFIPNLK